MSAYTCPECAAALAPHDRCCATCGVRVARVELLKAEIPVGEKLPAPVVRFHNTGAVPVHVWVPRSPVLGEGSPAWLALPPRCAGRAHRLEPGQVGELPFELLVRAFQRTDQGPIRVTACDLGVLTDADLHDQLRKVRLMLVGHAALLPAIVEFPCLPAGTLGEPVPLPFSVYNGGGRPLRIERIEVCPEPGTDAALAALVEVPILIDPIEVAPGETRSLELRLTRPAEDPPGGVLRAGVSLVCHHPGGVPPSSARLLFTVARPPRLEIVSAPGVQLVTTSESFAATLRNTGALPFEILGFGCADGWIEVAPRPRQVLAGGESLEVRWTVHPERRTGADLRATRLRGAIVVETAPPLPTPARIDVQVELEEVEELDHAVLGIDFGTSNSGVALLNPAGDVVSLEIETDAAPAVEMPSLMFYHPEAGDEIPFVFGNTARNRANIDPGNLVRSLKRVLTHAPDREWHFAWTEGEERRFTTRRTPELARDLIRELVRRSVEAHARLPIAERGTRASRVRFTRAVFTHPVKISNTLATTLWQAARCAGLDGGQTLEEFRRTSMLDEASAAIIHYLAWREAQGLPRRPEGDERVLCFDVGGGTTDVTAVHAREPEPDIVEVAILHTSGDNRFGGEDIDRAVAELVVDRARETEPELRGDLVLEALDVREPRALRARLGDVPPEEADLVAERAWRAAIGLIEQAERAKIAVGTTERARVLLPADFPRGPHATPGRAPVQVEVEREHVAAVMRAGTSRMLYLVDQAVQGARWTFDDVDTLLFTGQTSRAAVVREVVLEHVRARRSAGAPPLRVVDPVGSDQTPAFDPKACVAAGAARFGAWGGGLRVVMAQTLPFPLAYRNPLGRLIPIPGLEVGAPLPARGSLVARQSPFRLMLYAAGRLFGSVVVRDLAPNTEVQVVFDAEEQVWLEWGDGCRAPFTREASA